ncbi:MAG TPA: D-alanine--D-alanine ligase, partial [Sediminispirochaeta sp.]|nr:D-alanine--D-alanine ligase [Sediminispirochaeta sp.]
LEMLGIPYSGASPSCLALCYNKALVRSLAESLEIPVPLETYYSHSDQSATIPATFPALVKPNFGDGSVGINQEAVVHSSEELIRYIGLLKSQFSNKPFLIQEYLPGAEYSLGLIGNPGRSLKFLPILQVDYSLLPPELPKILGYESKWLPDSPYWHKLRYVEAQLSESLARQLQDYSLLLFERLGCRDYARFDFRTDIDGVIKLLEVNPNPGWCWDGKLNYMAGFAGLRYPELLEMIISTAQERTIFTAESTPTQ